MRNDQNKYDHLSVFFASLVYKKNILIKIFSYFYMNIFLFLFLLLAYEHFILNAKHFIATMDLN